MKMITKRGIFLWIMSLEFVVGLYFMTVSLVQNGDTWVMKRFNHHVYSNGELIGAGTIYDKDGDVLAETNDGDRVYSDSATTRKSTLHVVGDPKNFISTGVQSVYSARLTVPFLPSSASYASSQTSRSMVSLRSLPLPYF